MYRRLAEWNKAKTIWLAWPSNARLWQENLAAAQQEFINLVSALGNQKLVIVFSNQQELDAHKEKFNSNNINLKILAFGDIWFRDTLPIIVKNEANESVGIIPKFNGWGQKYLFSDDQSLSMRVARELGIPTVSTELVFEGGALEMDGEATMLTTEQCLLNPNRNPGWSKAHVEAELGRLFGVTKIIWLKEGLINDHTDGHIDTIVRFIAPAKVVIMRAKNPDDPNYKILENIYEKLKQSDDARKRKFEIIELPSPGEIFNTENELMPASYVNFIISNDKIIMPTYNSLFDQEALDILSAHTDVPVVGRSARAILSGGGAFHCISQEYFE
jgi:agmatine deiminase